MTRNHSVPKYQGMKDSYTRGGKAALWCDSCLTTPALPPRLGQSTDPFPGRLQCLPHCPPPHCPRSVLLFAGAGYSLLPHRASLNGVSPSPGVGHTPVPYPSCSVLCNAFAPTVVVRLIPMSSCHQTEWTSYVHALSKLIMWCWSWQPHSWSLGPGKFYITTYLCIIMLLCCVYMHNCILCVYCIYA